jgi:hypothetical protein
MLLESYLPRRSRDPAAVLAALPRRHQARQKPAINLPCSNKVELGGSFKTSNGGEAAG